MSVSLDAFTLAQMAKQVFHLADISNNVDSIMAVGKKANIRYTTDAHGSSALVIQTPPMIAPFGVSKYDNKGQIRFTLDLRMEDNSDVDVRNFWEAIETRIKQIARQNSIELFGKSVGDDLIDALFTSSIKENPSGDFPPLLRCVVPNKNGDMDCDFYGDDGSTGDGCQPSRGDRVQAIIELTRIWTMDKQFGCTPVVRAVKVLAKENGHRNTFTFLD